MSIFYMLDLILRFLHACNIKHPTSSSHYIEKETENCIILILKSTFNLQVLFSSLIITKLLPWPFLQRKSEGLKMSIAYFGI
jgi:hypothetical protein